MSAEKELKELWSSTDSDRIGSWADLEEKTLEDRANEGLFKFKASEFVIVEELDYDETIQRPETIRFFTLDEQVSDAYEKMVPRGRTTKFQLDVIKKESDRLRKLYLEHIVPTADAYQIREPEYGRAFSWISPVYAKTDLKEYSYTKSWIPMFGETRVRLPNFYRTMLTALPHPFNTTSADEGSTFPLSEVTEFVDREGENSIRALPSFQYPRTQRHEDGRFDVLSTKMENTTDTVKFVGYYAKKRPVPIPNPLPDHDFLKSSDAVMVETTAPLSEVVPSMDAILTHAVPVTHDPYGEGMKYLRVYDIKLSDIPWRSWKSRFPPAEQALPVEPVTIDFPKSSGDKPSENLMKYYDDYFSAQSSRYWLMNQRDGGELVVHMLMSQVGQNGTVAMSPGADGDFEYPATTIKECELMGLNFQEFSIRGLLRRTWGPKDKITYQCVPLELVKQERAREGHRGRKQWTETSHSTLLESYVKALVNSKPIEMKHPKEHKYESAPRREVSQLRHEVVVLLNDPLRLPEDKVRDITDLLKDAILKESIFIDSKGLFLLCLHTMSILLGDLAEDRRAFYDNWTARLDGFRVCKFCGEQINGDVLENQEEFTDEGRVIRHADALETKTFDGHAINDHIKTLTQLKDLFDFSLPSDEVFFMMISLLYVVPEVDQLLPILTIGRSLAAQIQKAKNINGGVVGIAQTILLLQSHVPALIPRRSFGSKPLTLRGYPRDADKPEGYTIVDSMLLVLSKTLEAYPTSFKGSSAITMRAVLNSLKKTRDLVVSMTDILIKQSAPLRTALQRAKEVLPAEEPMKPSTMLRGDLVVPAKDLFGTVRSFPACPSTRVYWTSSRPPVLKQPEVVLLRPINHFMRDGSMKKIIDKSVSKRVDPVVLSAKEKAVVARLKLGKDGVSEDWHTNVLIATRLASAFEMPYPLKELNPTQKADELRDITKGYVFELMKEIGKEALTKTKYINMKKDDLALMMLTADVKDAAAVTSSLKAKERIKYTERLRMMTDAEREITKDLVDRGLAPYIITVQDRILFAKDAAEKEAEYALDSDVGVGRTVDDDDLGVLALTEDQGQRGNYGDFSGSNAASGNVYEDILGNDFQDEGGQV